MKFHEIDWRLSATRRIFKALSEGLKDVQQDSVEAVEEFEVDDALDYTENLLGIAFVTAQTYVTGTVADANQLNKSGIKVTKEHLLQVHGDKVANSAITKLELCDAIANYYKHHDEWGSWSPTSRNQKTISILQAVNIEEQDHYPCCKAANILGLTGNSQDMETLLSLISNWREKVIAEYK